MRLRYIVFIFFMSVIPGWSSSSAGATYTDSLGRKVSLKGNPSRIVALAPSITEILYFLGLGERVVGVTKFSYYPPEATSKPKVGSYINLNAERIISLAPDLVISTKDGNQPGTIDLLEQAGIPVFVINPRNIRDVIDTISIIGRVCGVRERGDASARQLNNRIDRVLKKTESRVRPLVFLQINLSPIMTVNRNTFHHDLIMLAGGINMSKDSLITYPRISIEEVIMRRPEVIIISSMDRSGKFEKARQDWKNWVSIPAVRNNRVHLIDSDLIDRPSPRIVRGIEQMARILHPEVEWE